MASYQTSTHRAKWIFSSKELMEKYKAANGRAIQILQRCGTLPLDVDIDGSISFPEHQNNIKDKDENHSRYKPLNVHEEKLLRVFYEGKIQEVCGAFKFPHKIQATAIIYFKRFYLQWSVMEHHPKHIMLTCIYAACKVEENHVSAEELGKGIEQDHQMILNNEMIVYKSLEFDLIVFAPYRALRGFINDIEDLCQPKDDQRQTFKDLLETAYVGLNKIMLSDAPLLFPPGQLAIAALRRSNEIHPFLDFESYLKSVVSRCEPSHTISELTESLSAIDSSIGKLEIPVAEDMKHIDRKLRSCHRNSRDVKKKKERKSKHKSKKSINGMQFVSSADPLT